MISFEDVLKSLKPKNYNAWYCDNFSKRYGTLLFGNSVSKIRENHGTRAIVNFK